MPRFEFRAHTSVLADSEREAATVIDGFLDRVRAADREGENDHGFRVELDEGPADCVEED